IDGGGLSPSGDPGFTLPGDPTDPRGGDPGFTVPGDPNNPTLPDPGFDPGGQGPSVWPEPSPDPPSGDPGFTLPGDPDNPPAADPGFTLGESSDERAPVWGEMPDVIDDESPADQPPSMPWDEHLP